ncbi:type I restriction endonuclease subunit R [Pseudonocardia sp.]|uniref:type I restriction endonuclease subunit R n=1 Tax=Pseudonocardia sp. TaxID=60912 RepID=UPI003D12324D
MANNWVAGAASNFRRDLGLDTAVLFEFIGATQATKWAQLIRLHGGANEAQAKFGRRLAAEIDSRGTMEVLRHGVEDLGIKIRLAFFKPAHSLTPALVGLYDANRLVITRQVHHSETNPHDSLDVLLLLNGLPIATAELKNQVTGQNVEHAKTQYRNNRSAKDLIFDRRTVAHFAVDQDQVFLTTRLRGDDTYFLPFNEGSEGPGRAGGKGNRSNSVGYRTAYLWERVWQRDNWLDLLARFVHEEKPAGKGKKIRGKIIFPRYHQWDLVLRLAQAAAAHGPGRNYLAQHSAGSGKSNSIAWLAHRLSTLHTPADATPTQSGLGANEKVFHKVVVVTDRTVLDRQLQDTIWQFDHTPGVVERIDKDSRQLAVALSGSSAQIIITTLQKFPVIAEAATDLSAKRFAVIVDEAHSSQSGESAKDLKAVLGAGAGGTEDTVLDAAEQYDAALGVDPQDELADTVSALRASAEARGRQDNLSFFAFTATPKTKTLALFGEQIADASLPSGIRQEPFHLYSMRQAIEERFILDVLASYVTYSTYFRLANGLSSDDPEVDKGKANAALARFVALHPSNLAQKAEIIVEHFRSVTAREIGGRAKAMVVTRSRLHAVRYKQAIERYIAVKRYTDVHALVAFSGKVQDPDVEEKYYTESNMNRRADGTSIPETEIAARFKGDPPFDVDDYQLLIVAEKYQTGFDEPLLHTMYVDKKLDGVKAVQTLSRLNRTIPGKDSTFVLDFANKADDIKASFAPFYETTWTEPTDPNVLSTLKQRILDAGVIDPAEMRTMVTALLTSEAGAHAALYAMTDAAVERYAAIEQAEDREDFRTALRDFVRTYAFLGQVLPLVSTDFEELFYYGKVLLTRLPRTEDEGGVDISDAAVLTHIRTKYIAEHDLGLSEGAGEDGLPTMQGGGKGKQARPDKVRLSDVIDLLNDRFGTELTEVDQIWFDQQVEAAAADPDLRDVATDNTEENFAYVFDQQFAEVLIDRQAANDELFRMFFDKPEFKDALTAWARREVYRKIQNSTGGEAQE